MVLYLETRQIPAWTGYGCIIAVLYFGFVGPG